jgi:hypothetical protein
MHYPSILISNRSRGSYAYRSFVSVNGLIKANNRIVLGYSLKQKSSETPVSFFTKVLKGVTKATVIHSNHKKKLI